VPSLLSLADPHIASAAIARHPQLVWPVAALFVMCLLLGVTDTLAHRLHGRRSFTVKAIEQPVSYFLTNMSSGLLAVYSVWLWATFFSLLILRLMHRTIGFDLLACLNAYALFPLLIALLANPLRSVSRTGYWAWQVMATGTLLWFVADLWIGFAAGCQLSYGEAGLAAAPTLICLVTVGLIYGLSPLDTYRAVYRWHRTATNQIIVYSDLNLGSPLSEDTARLCAETLQSVILILEVEPLPYPIEVFLYSNEALRKRMSGNDSRHGWAAADSIHLPYDSWTQMRGTITHELAHVMREQRITHTPIALLEEGLTTYVEAELVRGSTSPPCITLENSLHVLANSTVFYEWLYTKTPENTWSEMYSHTHALTRYLVQKYGMKRYIELCRAVGSAQGTEPDRLEGAVQAVYHLSLKELERTWRNECDIVVHGPWMVSPWFVQVGSLLDSARVEAVGAGADIVSTNRLLAKLLYDERSRAFRILQQAEIDVSKVRHEIEAVGEQEPRRGKQGTLFSEPARYVIDQAVKEAVRQNACFVGTEHLLMGFLLTGSGNACDILTAAGLNLPLAREALTAVYKQIETEKQAAGKE
jgi:hypothetical protein